ncbi:MAG: catalase family peroxidase [Methyloceanibacter sp.]
MTSKTIATAGVAGLLALFVCMVETTRAAEPTPVDLVDALNAVFGKPDGTRSAHNKGFCLTGKFSPAPEAATLSKAAHFAEEVPITTRFSLGGGNPQAPDNAKANVRGLAVRFDLGDGASTNLVMVSAPVFFVQTPALFVEFLQAAGSGDKEKLGAFMAAHPESTRQGAWLNSRPVPASYAGVGYWGVHSFTFTNGNGDTALVKYKAIPDAGELGLTDEEAEAKGANFYEEELKERLAKGPVSFELVAIRGRDGDQTSDPTLRWDDEDGRETTPLGKISVQAIAPNATCDAFSFLPGNVTDGIAGSADDPIYQIRSADYLVSFARRQSK